MCLPPHILGCISWEFCVLPFFLQTCYEISSQTHITRTSLAVVLTFPPPEPAGGA